ncbi:MAG: DsbA family protein [Phycisphaeraceae bacterium]
MVTVGYYTDPYCPWSWGAEPAVRKLMMEFGDSLRWTFVMAGLERDLTGGRRAATVRLDPVERDRHLEAWLRAAAESGAPLDPLIWADSPPSSSHPACAAVKAAAAQADDGGYRYLRALREGIMCRRRKLDRADALVEVAGEAGLETGRFGVDLRSHGTTEELGGDLERSAALAAKGPKAKFASDAAGAPLPAVIFVGDDERDHGVFGLAPYEGYRDAAVAAGARASEAKPLSVEEALARFGSLTTPEVELLCELPGPRANAELFRLAEQWKVRAERVLTGYLWTRPT